MNLLTPGQLVRFWSLYLVSAPFAFLLRPLLEKADFQGWLSLISSYMISMGLIFGAVRAAALLPGPLTQSGQQAVGPWIHRLFMLILAFYCLYLTSLNLISFSDFFGSVYLLSTPRWVLIVLFLFCSSLVARSGLTIIVYMADGFFLIVFLGIFIVAPLLAGKLNYPMLQALLTHYDLKKWVGSTTFCVTWSGEAAMTGFILSYFRTNGKAWRYLIAASTISIVTILVYWLLCLLLFGPKLGASLRYPLLNLIHFIQFGEVVENLDPLLISIWATTLLVKAAFLLFLAAEAMAGVFRLRQSSSLVFPLALASLSMSFQFAKLVPEMGDISGSTGVRFFFIAVTLMPTLYYLASKFRLRRKKAEPQ